MKSLKTKFITLVVLSVLLSSCESMISEVDAPSSEPKLVVNSFITDGSDSVFVRLNHSRPLYTVSPWFDYQYNPVTDAVVNISDGISSTKLEYNPYLRKYFTTSLVIEAGKTYWLEATTPSGEKITSHCTVPGIDPPQAEIMSIEQNQESYYERSFSFRFADRPGEGDYYRVAAGFHNQYGPMPEDGYFETIWMQSGEEYVSDVNKDGDYFIYNTGWLYFTSENNRKVYLVLSITDEHYFNYHRSINSFEDDNPFAEPTPVYSNIEGGLGVFAAYRSNVTEVDLNNVNTK